MGSWSTYGKGDHQWWAIHRVKWRHIYIWSQCDRHFVGQHVELCVVKWWIFDALFESNWISRFKKMSVLSLSHWESDVYWRQNSKHLSELAPQNGGKQLIWRNYVTVTLCIGLGKFLALTTLWLVGSQQLLSSRYSLLVVNVLISFLFIPVNKLLFLF